MAEQFAFHHGLGQRTGVDGDEGPVAAAGQIVQGAGDHFLAGAGLAEDQHVGGDAGKRADLLAQALHGRRLTHQAAGQLLAVIERHAQAAIVQYQAAQLQCAAHAVEQRLVGEGLFQKIVGAGAHRLHGQRHVAVACNQQYRQLGIALAQLLQQLQAVDAGHADIADHHTRPAHRNSLGQALGIAQADDLEPGQIERLAERLAQMGVVVDQQYLNAAVDGAVAGHGEGSSEGCRLTPGLARRRRRVISAPPAG